MWPATAVLAADLVINVFWICWLALSFHLAVNTNHVIQMHVYTIGFKTVCHIAETVQLLTPISGAVIPPPSRPPICGLHRRYSSDKLCDLALQPLRIYSAAVRILEASGKDPTSSSSTVFWCCRGSRSECCRHVLPVLHLSSVPGPLIITS